MGTHTPLGVIHLVRMQEGGGGQARIDAMHMRRKTTDTSM